MSLPTKPILYHVVGSPPVHTVRMVAAAIDLELDLHLVNLPAGEHLKPEFLALNPQHTVPTLIDTSGHVLWDSAAISAYLIGKYGGQDDHPLYPKDLYTRARIDQRLHFNSSVAFQAGRAIVRSVFYKGSAGPTAEQIADVHGVYAMLEAFLAQDAYLVGPQLTLADLSLSSTVWSISRLVPLDGEKYPLVDKWLKLVAQLPYFDALVVQNVAKFTAILKGAMEKNAATQAAAKN